MSEAISSLVTKICVEAFKKKKLGSAHKERLALELNEINDREEWQYFYDLYKEGAKYSTNQNNLIVPYLLGIVDDFDPKKDAEYTIGEFPDIDVDIIDVARDHIKNVWAPQQFGKEYVCNICSYNTYQMRSSLLDIAKVYGKTRDDMLLVSKSLNAKDDDGDDMTWDKAYEVIPAVKEFADQNPEIFNPVKRIHKRTKSFGKHAGGLIISSKPLADLVPLIVDKEGFVQSAWAEGLHTQDLSPVGLIKYDFLGLKNLIQVAEIVKLVKKRYNLDSICALPGQKDWSDTSYLEDPGAIKLANAADLKCIFQFDSPGIRRLAQRGGVSCFDDLAVYSSLYRPGPLGMKMDERFIARKKGIESYDIHPLIEEYLGYTYGVMAYQEQVMRILNTVGEIPMQYCVGIIKAISKKKIKLFAKYKEQFIRNGSRNLRMDCSYELSEDVPSLIDEWEKVNDRKMTIADAANFPFYQGWEKPYSKAMGFILMFLKTRDEEKLKEVDSEFLHKEVAKAYARYMWDQIEAFAGYGFNKSHTIAYTYISWRLLWLKYHFPLEFYAGTLSCEESEDKIKDYKIEALIHGIKVNSIDINKSDVVFNIERKDKPTSEDEMYLGLSNIKGIGKAISEKIVESQPYHGFCDFLQRATTDARVVKPLIALRIFDDADPWTLYKYYEIYKRIEKDRKDRTKRHENNRKKYNNQRDELLEGFPEEYKSWDESILDVWKEAFEDDNWETEEKCLNVKSKNYGKVVVKKHNRWKKLSGIFDRRKKCIAGHIEKEAASDADVFTIGKMTEEMAEEEYVPQEFNEYFEDEGKAQMKFFGFLWDTPLEKSPDYTGKTFASFREEGYFKGPVEVVVLKYFERKWKSGKGSNWKLEVIDGNGQQQLINMWSDDWKRFSHKFEEHNLFRLNVYEDDYGWSLSSPKRHERHKLPPPDSDPRVLALKVPEE
jgi:DNA polymerase III alpha subunit